jgi:ABC-type nitrate/sulfonate/bicarbonate transport system substrate-binding protein
MPVRGGRGLLAVLGVMLLLIAVVVVRSTRSSGATRGEVTVLRYQRFVGQIGLPDLAASLGYLGSIKLRYIGNTISGPQDIQATVTGDVDFGNAFNGSILRLVAAGAKITTVIATQGADPTSTTTFLVRSDSPIRSARDLVGKTVGMNTVGAQNEDVLARYLEQGGLTPQQAADVQEVVISPASMEQALRSGQIDAVALSNSVLVDKAVARGGVRTLFSDYSLLGRVDEDSTVMRTDFVRRNPDTVRTFVTGLARALEWSKTHPRAEVIARMTSIARSQGGAQDISALQYWHTYGVATRGGVLRPADFSLWLARLEADGHIRPGQLKPGDTYTNQFNPYRSEVSR